MLAGTAIPSDEFHEEPQLEETNVSEEVHNAVRWAIMRVHKNLGHASKELLCRALRFGGANKIALRAASELTCDVCSEKSLTCLRSWLIRILNSIKALEWISLIGLRRTSVRVPEHCRSRFQFHPKDQTTFCRVLEMVWVNCAGPMNHLISDMGVEFEGELGEYMEAHGVRQSC